MDIIEDFRKPTKSYIEKLKDPRWQKKRLEILKRDNWACQRCFDTDSILHVHHRYYLKNHDPWDYTGDVLITLCEDCHNSEKKDRPLEDKLLLCYVNHHFLIHELKILSDGLRNAKFCHSKEIVLDTIKWILQDEYEQKLLIEKFFDNLPKIRGKK